MAGSVKSGKAKKDAMLAWWREARFGMFIHWGLYAVPAGVWKGKEVPGIGEWIMYREQIPVGEYAKLAAKFNPRKWDADAVARLAKAAGMKYIVITAKHHDGFAMYDSACSDYDIVDRTPYGKDPIKPLARACRRHGLKLCFYYSQYQDWHHPNGARNFWDYDEDKKDLDAYIAEKVKPQLRELLTEYGPVGLIWFDTPGKMTKQQSLDLKRFVHKLQPECLVSGRVGNDLGDYGSLGDNQIPRGPVRGDWETPATLNDTWGFKKNDKAWKSTRGLILLLCELAGKGVNYLLNIGPRADGTVPAASVKRLLEVGQWMKVNCEAIYGSSASPWPYTFPWGFVTVRGRRMYLLVKEWKGGEFALYGLKNRVRGAKLLADKRAKIAFEQSTHETLNTGVLKLELPRKAPERHVSVIALELDGEPQVDKALMQRPDGTIVLPAYMAKIREGRGAKHVRIGRAGFAQDWTNRNDLLAWRFKVARAGDYAVNVVTKAPGRRWVGGHEMKLTLGTKSVKGVLAGERKVEGDAARYHAECGSRIGVITVPRAGMTEVTLKAVSINPEDKGVRLVSVELVPLPS